MRLSGPLAMIAIAISACLVCAGCNVGPDFVKPEAPKTSQYLPGKPLRLESGANVPADWWRLFHAPKLDPIVREALKKNQTLQAAIANLRQSKANLQAGQGIYWPQVDVTAGVSKVKSNPASFGVEAPASIFGLFTVSAAVTYALDLFGSHRRANEGLEAKVESSRFAAEASYLTLTTNVVNAVIARAAYQAEADATRALIEAQKKEIALTRASVKSGTVPYSNLLSLRSQLAANQAALPPILQKIDQSDHLLALLSGEPPSTFALKTIQLEELRLPEALPTSLPSELARERPDILQAEADLHAASAQVGVATAALYPSFAVTANVGYTSTRAETLLNSDSSLWNIGASLAAPIFRGGTLRAQKEAAVEAFHSSLANYRQTVIAALTQVADVLTALDHDSELVQAESEALASSEEALKIVDASFRAGTAGYLQLLVAIAQFSQSKIGYLQAVAQRYQDTVALFAAMGGGWWNRKRNHPLPGE